MSDEWLEALAPLGTDWHKPFLETVPWLVVVFEEVYGLTPTGQRRKNFYVKESVGIACGLFIVALHDMGLATLTHTPSPMAFLSRILGRPTTNGRTSSSRSATRRRTPGPGPAPQVARRGGRLGPATAARRTGRAGRRPATVKRDA